jgi:hypothetical protein
MRWGERGGVGGGDSGRARRAQSSRRDAGPAVSRETCVNARLLSNTNAHDERTTTPRRAKGPTDHDHCPAPSHTCNRGQLALRVRVPPPPPPPPGLAPSLSLPLLGPLSGAPFLFTPHHFPCGAPALPILLLSVPARASLQPASRPRTAPIPNPRASSPPRPPRLLLPSFVFRLATARAPLRPRGAPGPHGRHRRRGLYRPALLFRPGDARPASPTPPRGPGFAPAPARPRATAVCRKRTAGGRHWPRAADYPSPSRPPVAGPPLHPLRLRPRQGRAGSGSASLPLAFRAL